MPDFKDTIYTDEPHQYQATHVRQGFGEIVMIDPVSGDGPQLLAHGPRLRDALLEAFPLEEKAEEPPAKRAPVPGMVFRDRISGDVRVVLPSGWYNVNDRRSYGAKTGFSSDCHDLVCDPRGAKALPNPLGIRVGDRVRRTNVSDQGPGRAVYTDTTEFEVNHIDGATGHISPKYGAITYKPKGFEVTSREVPDRLPAGTIVRWVRHPERLRLITDDGGIYLTDGVQGPMPDKSDYDRMVREGAYEVIYLPES